MKITFIMPAVGKKKSESYVRSWIMEPLGLAILSSLTPPEIEKKFFDDRLEEIPYDESTDLVAINAETYTAKRAYQIAAKYKQRNVPVVMGGYHPTLMPEEAAEHVDAIVIGEAEQIWEILLNDFKNKQLKKFYKSSTKTSLNNIFPDRSLFKDKKYFPVTLIETGRGCKFNCEFCSINAFYKRTYSTRPIDNIIDEIKRTRAKRIFFVDDNIVNDRNFAFELFKRLIPLKINWISQASMHIHNDDQLLALMKKSGCRGVLIGFESLNKENLEVMGKHVNNVQNGYEKVVAQFHKHKMAIYGTFIFGYNDTPDSFKKAYDFALKNKLFYAAFNHLVPFPGTSLYEKLKREGKLLFNKWWLDSGCYFGNIYFKPKNLTPEKLEQLCYKYRYKFFSLASIIKRSFNFRVYWQDIIFLFIYFANNLFANRETDSRHFLPFGDANDQ